MLTYPNPDPVLLSLGALDIYWYGVMYLLAFGLGWALARGRATHAGWQAKDVDDLLFYVALGVVLGGRLGYIIFYALDEILLDPSRILRVWEGGMSFHGGLLGVLLAVWLFARKSRRRFFNVTDFIAPFIPIGLFFGRIGNFINAELWGGPTQFLLGMRVPCERAVELCMRVGAEAGFSVPVHPTQLYEAILEGPVLFALLWIAARKPQPRMAISGLFLLGYGLFRFAIEWLRLPDAHIGYLLGDWLTMGMLLTLPMLLFGTLLLFLAYRQGSHRATVS